LSRARSAKWRVRGDLKSEGIDGLIAALNHKPDLLTETTARGKRPLEDYADGGFREISTMIWHGPGAGPRTNADEPDRQLCATHRGRGFAGVWAGESLGRTLDPLTALAAFAAVTEHVELGVAVLQLWLHVEPRHTLSPLGADGGRGI
jgi:hypothetical protein